jgi:hypothetical protein
MSPVPSYKDMATLMERRAQAMGLAIGVSVLVGRRRGTVDGHNALFFSDDDPAVYVNFPRGASRRLIRASMIIVEPPCAS